MTRRGGSLEASVVTLVALHSLGVGLVLLLAPQWALRLGGWEPTDHLFFVRQGGAFHLVVALGYALEYRQRRSTDFLVGAKSVAVIFLFTLTLIGDVPPAVPLAGAGDLVMLAVVLLLRRSSGSPAPGAEPPR